MIRYKFLPTTLKKVQQKNSTGIQKSVILVREEGLLCAGEVQTAATAPSLGPAVVTRCTAEQSYSNTPQPVCGCN